jgi:hypothetical protein
MFSDLLDPDPDPLVRGMDPDPDPHQNVMDRNTPICIALLSPSFFVKVITID